MAKRSLIGLAVLALMGACSSTAPPPAPPPQVVAPPESPPVAQAAPPPAPAKPKDTCGAVPLQSLVGKPHTDIPAPLDPSLRRVICSTCVMTEDFVAARQTIIYDTDTGLVKEVRCG